MENVIQEITPNKFPFDRAPFSQLKEMYTYAVVLVAYPGKGENGEE